MHKGTSENTSIQYAANLYNVREVTLHGTADLSFWQAVLEKEGLLPYYEADEAILLLSAIDAKWRGFKFKEFVIGVAVCNTEDGTSLDGYYLPCAFNSSKLLAFSERMFFKTPYFHGDIRLQNRIPPFIKLQDKTEVILHAEMSIPDTPPIVEYLEWQGPIFLPNNGGKFFAILSGEAEMYPFSSEVDTFDISPLTDHEIFRQLIESNFIGSVWALRSKSRHAKSKTYRRDAE